MTDYLPRHDDQRAQKLANRPPWHRRRWVRRAAVAVAALALTAGVFEAGHWAGHTHAHQVAEAEQHSHEPESQVVVEHAVPDQCLQALSHAENGLELSADHFKSMTTHIRETGSAGRHHLEEMDPVREELADLREAFEQTRLGCELQPPEQAQGGGGS